MASSDFYTAAINFLSGDFGDIKASINAEQTGLMINGSVYVSRGGRDSAPRLTNTPPVTVELCPIQGEWPARMAGIGMKEREFCLNLRITAYKKDLRPGKTQLVTVANVARAIYARYDGASNLSIAPSGSTFRRSSARITQLDDTPESDEFARAIVELRLVFTEALAAN